MKQQLSEHLNKIIKYAVITLSIAIVILVPENLLFNHPSVCLFHHLTGCLCPLCGMTHASHYLLKMHPALAFSYNPSVFWFPFLLFVEILNDLFPQQSKFRLVRRVALICFLGSLLLIFIFRIINCIRWDFCLLAPDIYLKHLQIILPADSK